MEDGPLGNKYMNIVLITGSHPRHKFIARKLAERGDLSLIICQKRESFVPQPPSDLNNKLSELYLKHFQDREENEYKYFGDSLWPNVEIIEVEKSQQNSDLVRETIAEITPDLLLTYGCGILSEDILDSCSCKKEF